MRGLWLWLWPWLCLGSAFAFAFAFAFGFGFGFGFGSAFGFGFGYRPASIPPTKPHFLRAFYASAHSAASIVYALRADDGDLIGVIRTAIRAGLSPRPSTDADAGSSGPAC